MATAYHNLSEYDFNSVPNAEAMKFWYRRIRMEFQYYRCFTERRSRYIKKTWSKRRNILVKTVPGSFRNFTFWSQPNEWKIAIFDAIIAIGCVIKGDTPHF